MDLTNIIEDLEREKKALERVIASLEELQSPIAARCSAAETPRPKVDVARRTSESLGENEKILRYKAGPRRRPVEER